MAIRDRELRKRISPHPHSWIPIPFSIRLRVFLAETLGRMEEAVSCLVPDLVLDPDEVGASEWTDRKTKRVVGPASLHGHTIHHGVNRNMKQVTIVPCVAPSGKHLIPYVLTCQHSKSLRVDLQKHRIEFGQHLVVQGSQKVYVNGKIFSKYTKSIFLPYLPKSRSEREIEQQEAALLMGNCPSHLAREVMDMLTTAKVRIVTFAMQTKYVFQLLDLTLLGTFKWVGKYQLPFDDLALCFVHRLYMDFKRTLTLANIWAVFRGIGIEFDMTTVPYRVIFHSEKLRESKGFKELWGIDFLLDALSTRRRSYRFGWLNKLD
jgi:hypothetical protein